MFKFPRKAIPGIFVILAMLLGAWTVPFKASKSEDTENHKNIPDSIMAQDMVSKQSNLKLNMKLDKLSDVQQRIDEIYNFRMDFSAVSSSNVSDMDKEFVQDSITSNSLELWTMQYAVKRVKNQELRNLIEVMITMHSKDLQDAITLAGQLGVDTKADFVNASVYPETPDYDLGVRMENLKSDYLDHLVERAGVSFDEVALDILDQEHASDVQSELTAERLVKNDAMRAFTKHSADVTELHMKLLDNLHARLSDKFDEPPSTDFQSNYQAPNMFTPDQSQSGSK